MCQAKYILSSTYSVIVLIMQHLSKHRHQLMRVHTWSLKTHSTLHMLSKSLKSLNSASSKCLGQQSNEDCSQFTCWHCNVHLILCATQLPALRKKSLFSGSFFFNICLAIVMTSYLCSSLFDVSSFCMYMRSNSKKYLLELHNHDSSFHFHYALHITEKRNLKLNLL